MLKIHEHWGETPRSLLERALTEDDHHLRRRLMALHFVACGDPGVEAARKVGRCRAQVAKWVHEFNRHGPRSLALGWRGNPGKALDEEGLEFLKETVSAPPPVFGIDAGRWTAALATRFVNQALGKSLHQETVRRYLKDMGIELKSKGV